jgi:uncharacterized PurR-regulated membrane protein YhhQ (DUF165 family)
MEIAAAVETRRPIKETALEKLARETRNFFAAVLRVALLSALLIPVLLASFLTIDVPLFGLDHFFTEPVLKPSKWLSCGYLLMAGGAPLVILIARRFGGEEASRVVTASWAVAAFAAFAGVSYLSPELESGDLPAARYAVAFVASAILAQFGAAAIYDLTRGREAWWRAPFFAALGAGLIQSFLYFPVAYWTAVAPWMNWMVQDIALKSLLIVVFLGVYRLLMKRLKPRGGYGG